MEHFTITTIFFLSLTVKSYSQGISYDQSVENIYKHTIGDFGELFYQESGLKQRVYYSCPDTNIIQDCTVKRKIYFNNTGQIIADTSFIDTLFSSTNRIFEPNKITIIKTHPQPSLFKYDYKTTVDSLLIDSLNRPIKYFENGIFLRKWEYDSSDRLVCYCENPNREIYLKKRIYQYLPDTIIERRFNRSISKFDTTYNYLVFDNQNRLIRDISGGNSIKYRSKGRTVLFDTVISNEIYPQTTNIEYEYPSDSLIRIVNHSLSMTQIMILDAKKEIKTQKMLKNNTIVLGEYQYHRDTSSITILKFEKDELYSTEIQDLRPDGKISCRTIHSMNNKRFEHECYSVEGMILEKKSIYDGKIMENLISLDK